MHENKKGAMPTDQSSAKLQNDRGKAYQPNNTTETPDLSSFEPYRTILDMLKTGEKNAVHLKSIMKKTELKNRGVRKCIEHLRRSGTVIISNKNGYFKPETPDELQKYINQEEHRAKSVFYTLKNARQLMKQFEGVE